MNQLPSIKILLLLALNLVWCGRAGASAPFATWTTNELKLNNGVVARSIKLPSPTGNFLTKSYQPVSGEFKYFEPSNPDFQFEFGGTSYSGNGKWSMAAVKTISDAHGGDGAAVTLLSADRKIELTVNFFLYPEQPVIRKSLMIKNLSDVAAVLESVDVEKFSVTKYYATTFSWICSDYARRRSIGPYDGNLQDALVIVHNQDWAAGIVIGNEAAGVMKHTSVFWDGPTICSGLTHKDARFPFRKWLKPGESFETPQVFTMVYNGHKDPDEMLNTAVPDFVRRHMGIRLSELKEKPTFVYNTWNPFKKDINEPLIRELAKAAADAGMKEFVIDDGWQDSYGDWGIDKKKFPNGLKPVFDYIKSLGMKPGLWVSVGSAAPESQVFQQHPEWFVKDINGKLTSIHGEAEKYTACFSTGWQDYIKTVLKKLMLENGLEYLKLDFAVVTSPYVFDPTKSGCYATDHIAHQDHAESLYINYEPLWKLFDELHQLNPDLFIDCTFETMGGLQLIDYAMLKHAEGDWLSNFNEPDEKGDLRVRNMAWWRSPAVPATALVIGNPAMDDQGWENHVKSLAGALPIMLGDPRKISPSDVKKYRDFSNWLQSMATKYDILSFRQDLPGLGEPKEGSWDGFQRINTETKQGGIIGVFRHGALETKRTVFVHYLDPAKTYEVKALDGKVVFTGTGGELANRGFEIQIESSYAGRLFEVSTR